jgi:hypothetical protein
MFGSLVAAVCGIQATLPPPPKVEVVQTASGWELRRGGQPYFVKGGGGSVHLDRLAQMGGNSIRTWGDGPDIPALLDKAHAQGLTVCLGIWLGHERHGFDYTNKDQVSRQFEEAKRIIRKYRSHPAVLMWGIGNEMEGFDQGDNPNIWKAVNDIAKMAQEEDPNRPTITVIAEVGGKKVPSIHNLAPEIDIVGINTYGGAGNVIDRYKAAGGVKPVILTEFGPIGTWEAPKTPWGVAIEPTSTEKGRQYRTHYEKAVDAHPGLTLGSYAFIWGWKQEVTATWFGMLLKDGSTLAAAEEMSAKWKGRKPSNLVPVIESIELGGPAVVAPNGEVTVTVKASDPDKDSLNFEWVLKTEATVLGQGGDAEPEQKIMPEALVKGNGPKGVFRAPAEEAGYRIFLTIRDGKGGAATANIPIMVEDPKKAPRGKKTSLPFHFIREGLTQMPWAPSGKMNQPENLVAEITTRIARTPGGTSMAMAFNSNAGWGGVAFQDPPNDWGTAEGGYDLTGAKRVSFWARGEKGGEKVKFEFGILRRGAAYFDTATGEMQATLSADWKEYSLDLAGKDLRRIKTGFVWTAASEGAPIRFYVADARYE